MKIGISIIGTNPYTESEYKYGEKTFKTNLFPAAFNNFVKPDKLFVLMTEDAKLKHGKELSKLCFYEEILIPFGKSNDEIWKIFDRIVSIAAQEGNSEISFDITHGFRSQPFIVIGALMYLRTITDIKLNSILYGAFDAKDSDGFVPVFDLKPFIELIDWSNATSDFITYGNMKGFRNLISSMETRNSELLGIGTILEKLTTAFDLINTNEVFKFSKEFKNHYDRINFGELENSDFKPFVMLLPTIKESLSTFSAKNITLFNKKGMEAQKEIMRWYMESGQYQKALTLAREFVVSHFMINELQLSESDIENKPKRELAAESLGKLNKIPESNCSLEQRKYKRIWNDIVKDRNWINHAGMVGTSVPSTQRSYNIRDNVDYIINNF